MWEASCNHQGAISGKRHDNGIKGHSQRYWKMLHCRPEDRARGQEPRNAGGLQKLELAKKCVSPSGLQKKCHPADTLDFYLREILSEF